MIPEAQRLKQLLQTHVEPSRQDYPSSPHVRLPMTCFLSEDEAVDKQFSKGKLTEITDASGSSGFTYDTLGRLIIEQKTVDDTTYTIQRTYDLLGRLTTLIYPNNDLVTYTYNDQGGINTIILQSPFQAVQPIIKSLDYNAAGQITKMVYGNGVTTDYAYNPQTLRLQNLKSVGPGGVIQDFTYNFDAVGNVQSIADAVHTASQSFTYDFLNRLVSANGARYGGFTYAYNQVGNMTGKEGVVQNYGALNHRPHAVTSTSSGLALTYDANGNLASKSGPGRLAQNFIFDAENRLVEVNNPLPARRLDPGWNFISFPQVIGEVPVTSVITNFTGNCEQLTRFNASSNWFESFANLPVTNQFDTVSAARGYALYVTNTAGMILPLGDTPAAPSPQFLVPGKHLLPGPAETMSASNWLAGLVVDVDYTDVRALVSGTTNLAATATVRPGQAYYVTLLRTNTWTPPSASRIENPSSVRFVYDGDGGRVKKITSSGVTVYLGHSYEVSPSGQSTIFVFAEGQRIAAKDSRGSLRIYHCDHINSANVISDQTGMPVELTENTPYGSISRNEGAVNVAHKFTSQQLDDETGLYFYNARYYDPEIGRFISPDSFVSSASIPQGLNRYTYANNNPLSFIDPTGHKSFWTSWGSSILQVFGAALAPFTGGASLLLSFGGTVWSGVQAAQAGQFGSWATGFGASLLLGGVLGPVNFANPWMQLGVSGLRGTALGAISGGIGSLAGGGRLESGLSQGALGGLGGGLISGALSSQQFTDWAKSMAHPNDFLSGFGDFAGKLWALPDTAVGLTLGIAGVPFGTEIHWGNNAIQFENYPWGLKGGGAITLGNVQLYHSSPTDTFGPGIPNQRYDSRGKSPEHQINVNVGLHEEAHTVHSELLGPLYLPTWILSGGQSSRNGLEQSADNYSETIGGRQ